MKKELLIQYMKRNKIFYKWETLDRDCQYIASRIKPIKFNFKNIYGVPRGGLIIAVVLSHLLSLPIILERKNITKNTLIVDDINDTGDTLRRLLRNRKYGTIATLWVTPTSKILSDYAVRLKEDKDWIVFPFETLKSSRYDKTI